MNFLGVIVGAFTGAVSQVATVFSRGNNSTNNTSNAVHSVQVHYRKRIEIPIKYNTRGNAKENKDKALSRWANLSRLVCGGCGSEYCYYNFKKAVSGGLRRKDCQCMYPKTYHESVKTPICGRKSKPRARKSKDNILTKA